MKEASDRVLAVDAQLPAPGHRSLDRALRAVDAGPRPCYRAALVSLAVTSLLIIAICVLIRPAGALPGPQRETIAGSLAGLIIAAGLGLVSVRARPGRTGRLDAAVSPQTRAAIWLALTAWIPFLVVWAYYRAAATLPRTVVWIAFGYLDKRWLTCLYLLGALAPMIFLVAAARVLAAGRGHPASWRAWLRDLVPAERGAVAAPGRAARWPEAARVAAGLLTALAVAYYFYGPPWQLSHNNLPIGAQEDVFLAGMQAISTGHLPYLGPAAIQYGPGAQLISYLFMRHLATFSVLGFRQSWALFQWAGASVFFVALFLAFGYARGLVASLLSALVYPALRQLGFHAGAYTGFFGWANPLRYAGAISLVILLPAVIRRCPARRSLAGGAVLGMVFGLLSYIAQENLIGGAVGAVAVAVLLMLSGTASRRAVLTALATVAAGFVLVWLPVLVFYTAHGDLGRFLYLYLLIPRAVAEGYSNSALHRPTPWVTMFYVLPFLLAVLALLSVVEFRPLRVAFTWSRERIMVVAVLITTILLYQGALLRSDSAHLTGTLLILPAMIIVVAAGLPRLLGATRRRTLATAGIVVFAASFALLPYQSYRLSGVRSALVSPYDDRQAAARTGSAGTGAAAAVPVSTLAARRVGAGLVSGANCCQGVNFPMSSFIALMNHLHAIVGNRVAYVVGVPRGYPGLVYFVADLNPAPIPEDPWTLVLTAQQEAAWLADFRENVLPRTKAVITPALSAPAAVAFLQQYPRAREYDLRFGASPYYVLVAG